MGNKRTICTCDVCGKDTENFICFQYKKLPFRDTHFNELDICPECEHKLDEYLINSRPVKNEPLIR